MQRGVFRQVTCSSMFCSCCWHCYHFSLYGWRLTNRWWWKIPCAKPQPIAVPLLTASLLLGGILPTSHLYSLSRPERDAMESCINDSLAFWSTHLSWIEYAHISLVRSATGMLPFQPPLVPEQDTKVAGSTRPRAPAAVSLGWQAEHHIPAPDYQPGGPLVSPSHRLTRKSWHPDILDLLLLARLLLVVWLKPSSCTHVAPCLSYFTHEACVFQPIVSLASSTTVKNLGVIFDEITYETLPTSGKSCLNRMQEN